MPQAATGCPNPRPTARHRMPQPAANPSNIDDLDHFPANHGGGIFRSLSWPSGIGSSSPQVLQGPTGKPARPQNASIESSSRPSIEFWRSAAEAAAFKFWATHLGNILGNTLGNNLGNLLGNILGNISSNTLGETLDDSIFGNVLGGSLGNTFGQHPGQQIWGTLWANFWATHPPL